MEKLSINRVKLPSVACKRGREELTVRFVENAIPIYGRGFVVPQTLIIKAY